MSLQDGQAGAVPLFVKTLTDTDDAAALLLAAKASEQSGDTTRALGLYRRLYFYAPAAPEAAGAAAALARLNSTPSPATADEATARADKLFAAKRYAEATDAYADGFARFAAVATVAAQSRRSIAAANARRIPEAVAALGAMPISAVDERSEALHHLALAYARARQWDAVRSTLAVMTSAHTRSPWTMRALVVAGQLAKEAKNTFDAAQFFRAAVNTFPGQSEVASAQFELAWQAHEAKNFQESSRLLVEHLAEYAGKNTDNRGRAGYWAARDSERAGRLSEARALYRAMLARYDANWYGYLAKQRLDAMARGAGAEKEFPADSPVGRAAANLVPVTIATETAGPEADKRIAKADQLSIVGLDEWAHEELDKMLESTPTSPRLNLAKARIFRSRDENVQAFNVLRRSFPDYSQMKPEELTSDEWDVFYPLAHWEIITQEARARNLDPYTVAGLIRQESVFNPRAASSANAYGLMQLLVPTGRLMAKRAGVERPVNVTALFEPRLNIQLGTSYMRDNIDKFGRIEYVAAAYNAGPGRIGPWRASLPLEIDEWVEAIPFKETRGYVQGVVRNTLQYRRLYDERGRFRAEVGTRAPRRTSATNQAPALTLPADNNIRPRRATGNDEED
ncbi:MAG: transglycosylase SLT domain-containing protein [Acidobacteriota bacterium]|nr:transglycosylase SLT domain-containing protein [Acidobacteriota bacterium]